MNTQPAEGREQDASALDVHSIFPTIQGEGPYSGWPCVFVRLAGCNITCPGCDTEYTATRARQSVEKIVQTVRDIIGPNDRWNLVVITGGEPFRQNITELIALLQTHGLHVQIETNGTLPPSPLFETLALPVTVVCSPKGSKVAQELIPFISAYKYVLEVNATSIHDGLPESVLGAARRPARPHKGFDGPIYVSPMDVQDVVQNKLNTAAAAAVCMSYGYILNLQIHKIVGLP